MKVDDAIAQATALGLVPNVQPAHIWSSRNIISDQDLTPGTFVEVGSTVQLRYN
jgi:hypothetical protein